MRSIQIMKRTFIKILFVFFILGCATIPKDPLKPDEVRLTKLRIIEKSNKDGKGKHYKAIVEYQYGEKIRPDDIKLTCTTLYWQG